MSNDYLDFIFSYTLWSGCFYLFYKLLLSKTSFHTLNRFLLIGGLIFPIVFNVLKNSFNSIITPVSTINFNTITIDQILEGTYISTAKTSLVHDQLFTIVSLLYIAGALFFLTRYCFINVFTVIKLRKSKKTFLKNGDAIYSHSQKYVPFVFMNRIYVSDNDINSDFELIYSHEKAHAAKMHFIDIILSNIVCALFWFNPFVWLLYKEIKTNHEYEADQTVIKAGASIKDYQLLLIKKSAGSNAFVMANLLTGKTIHKRIKMMFNSNSGKMEKLKYLLIVPLAIGVVKMISSPIYASVVDEANKGEYNLKSLIVDKSSENLYSKKEFDNLQNTSSENDSIDYSVFVGNVSEKLNTKDAKINKLKAEDSLANVEYQIDGKNVTKEEFEKTQIGDKTKKTVRVFKTKEGIITTTTSTVRENNVTKEDKSPSNINIKGVNLRGDSIPLVIVDGNKIDGKQIKDIDAEIIKSVTVLKGESAKEIFGEDGKNGVVIINTKDENNDQKMPYIISIDNENKIENLSGRYIKTTTDSEGNITTEVKGSENFSLKLRSSKDQIDGVESIPLIFIDDKESSMEELQKIGVDKIESMSIIKNEKLLKEYGEKGKNGVIVIKLKASKQIG
ncbi:MAG: M56 family metallopeptidase [Bacteroidales bacterium]|nr:M56 family metallopeptidase [Bacteroidales bacterium]